MLSRHTDLPLDRDVLGGFLPWLIAFMVFLAVVALAGMLVLHTLAGRWDRGLAGTMTVQAPASGDRQADARNLSAAVTLLREAPGVDRAEIIDETRVMALLAPWLGTSASAADLPLPRLIDVTLLPGAAVDAQVLAQSLAAVLPGASVDDHRVWLDHMVRLIRSAELLALSVLLLIALATAGTVVFTTRAGLAVHQEVIEVLHLIGAQDDYVARQFAHRALALGLRGGILGLVIAVPALMGVGALARRLEAGLMPELALAPIQWAALALPSLAAAVIAMLTARLTVTRTLGRMP